MGFKEEQNRIEDGILSALDRLSKFEEAIEKSLKDKQHSKPAKDAIKSPGQNVPQKKTAKEEVIPLSEDEEQDELAAANAVADAAASADADADAGLAALHNKICFEIPDTETADDIVDPLTETLDEESGEDNAPAGGGELDIF